MNQDLAVTDSPPRKDLVELWSEILKKVQGEIPSPYFTSMILPLRPETMGDGTLTVGVPNAFTKDIIESRYLQSLTRAVREITGQQMDVALAVSVTTKLVETIAARSAPREEERRSVERPQASPLASRTGQKKYTFENFIVGDSNKFAYNAALMVAEVPGYNYNPLFIYGGTGLGKTHLLLAIKEYAEKLNPNIKVRHVQTSVFIDDFVATITMKRDKSTFDQKYINNKILLFDDIQALSGTDATQNKFFDVFNLLHSSNSHIVLSSDRSPRELSQLSDRIQSRFEGGLIIDVKPPDLETRLAILRLKSQAEGIEVPDDAMIYIASRVKTNIRVLEGVLNRVVAYARLYGMRIDLPMVQELLKDQVVETDQSKTPTVDLIQNLASNYFKIARADLVGKSRSRSLVHGRQVAMYLCRELTTETLISIGSSFGDRDHSTVLHSCRKVDNMMRERRDILQEVQDLTNMINKAV